MEHPSIQLGTEGAAERPRLPSPLEYFLIALVAVAALSSLLPDIGAADLLGGWTALGALPLAVGLMVMLRADTQFRQAGTTARPFRPATRLVTDGVFAWSRHPMYLGMTLMLAGLAVLLASIAALAVAAAFAWVVERTFLLPEEWRLESQFGRAYREYRQSVGRWVSLPLG